MTYKCLLGILLELPLLRALRDLLGLEGFISKSAIRVCLSKGRPLNAARENACRSRNEHTARLAALAVLDIGAVSI